MISVLQQIITATQEANYVTRMELPRCHTEQRTDLTVFIVVAITAVVYDHSMSLHISAC